MSPHPFDRAPTGDRMPALTARARSVLAALPRGTNDLARASLTRGLVAAGQREERRHWLSDEAVARQLVRPLIETDSWPGPSQPLAVGRGAVHADLIDDDHELLARLRSILAADTQLDAETLAAEAQAWRLPVTPYRRRPNPRQAIVAQGGADEGLGPGQGWDRVPVVVDLSSLWAGPLATGLLAQLGARVVKIDPECRPDGFRAHRCLYQSLNDAKEIVDLDLRRPDDRRRFEALVAGADLVVDSFSRRVMPNFGYGPTQLRALNPALATLSIVAFPAGTAEADWVSYGPGVHAVSGLGTVTGDDGDIRFQPAAIAYPNALAGLEAFAVAAELLATDRPSPACDSGHRISHREVSLAGALEPLVAGRG